jgi:hypothetical protein
MIIAAAETAGRQFEMAAFYPDRLAVDNRLRQFFAGGIHDAYEGGARNVHAFGALSLYEVFAIFKPYSLDLLYGEINFFQFPQRNTGRFEISHLGNITDAAVIEAVCPYALSGSLFWTYVHNSRINYCILLSSGYDGCNCAKERAEKYRIE